MATKDTHEFWSRGIPLIHQIAVAGPFLGQGVATLLIDAAEQLVRDRGIAALGYQKAGTPATHPESLAA
jgi:GNAT superfamily N-acetyltransferase